MSYFEHSPVKVLLSRVVFFLGEEANRRGGLSSRLVDKAMDFGVWGDFDLTLKKFVGGGVSTESSFLPTTSIQMANSCVGLLEALQKVHSAIQNHGKQ